MSFLRLLPALLLPFALSHGAFPTLYLKPVVLQQFHSPTCVTYAPDGSGRVFVVDQPGRVYIIENGMMQPTPFLDISSTATVVAQRKVIPVGTGYVERGLLGLAFHPGYANPASPGYRKFYVNYNKTYEAGIDPPQHDGGAWTVNSTTVIAEFQVSSTNANSADPLSERKLLRYPQPQANHNGGNMVMDGSGLLYIGSGDGGNAADNGAGHNGGSANNALGNGQDKTVCLGKILRIDPLGTNGPGGQYGIPPGNPFVGAGGGVKEEIYAFGIRNPWGMSLDDGPGGTGRLFCADVGQDRVEEVNIIINGGNFGWRYLEGNERPSFSSTMAHPGGTLTAPIVEYAHSGITGTSLAKLGLSVTGGSVYRGSAIPALQGKYVFGDYGATAGSPSGILMGLEETAPGSGTFIFTPSIPLLGGNPFSMRVICMGEDESGEIYVGTKVSSGVTALENGLPNGGLYKLVPVPTNPAPITLTAVKDNSMFSEGELSNGTGDLFAGTSSAIDLRRGLLAFDLSSVPADARMGSAILQLRMTSAETPSSNPARNTTLSRLSQSWGEAGSNSGSGGAAALSGDATWVNRFYSSTSPLPWDNDGGDFSTSVSSSFNIRSELGYYAFQGPQMVNDVHAWLTAPAMNHGWILRSDEGAASTTKRFSSRENADSASRPKLTLIHATPYQNWLAAYFPGLLTGQYLDPEGDADSDGIYNQIEYAYGLNPTGFNAADNFSTVVTPAGVNTDLTLTFRRDTQATDLTYHLQVSEDLTTWTSIAQSTGGAAATGQNGGTILSDAVLIGTVKLVTVKMTLTGNSVNKQFVRLSVDRAP
ncbi:MAG: PQQ-dependent sugar dehydrogenase [Verrucomicrobiota bacterium]